MASSRTYTRSPSKLAIQNTRSISTANAATPCPSNGATGIGAMCELLSSERTYARELALVCNVHIPLAQCESVSTLSLPTTSQLGDLGPRPPPSFSSANPPQFGPPMTSNDMSIVFRNITGISNFSLQFVKRLEMASEHDGSDEDKVGKLFLEIIPVLEPLYKTYLRTHSSALAHLQGLSLSPAYWKYTSDIRNILLPDVRVPDLPSLLMKPEQRVPEYCRLLGSIVNTSSSSDGSSTALVQARAWMEKFARDLSGRKYSSSVHPIKTLFTSNGTNGPVNLESNKLAQLESRLDAYRISLDRLAERVKDWEIATRRSVESLQRWGTTFGGVLGLETLPSAPRAYEAFVSLLSSLQGLSTTLEDDLQTTLYPLLQKLKTMTEHPKRLLAEMHFLERPRTPSSPWKLWRSGNCGDRFRYLQSTLLSELPVLLDAMDRAIGLALRSILQGFLKSVRKKWIDLFDSLKEDSERYGGTEETLRTWRKRWEVGWQALLVWEEKYVSAVRSETSLPMRLPTTSEVPAPTSDVPPAPRVVPPHLRMRFSFPPSSRTSSHIRQSLMSEASGLYTIRATRRYSPPPHEYRGYSFFKLSEGDCFDVLEEYDHPSSSAHIDLPRSFVSKMDEDCLLKVRARNNGAGYGVGAVGWVLARFVSAD